VYLTTDKCLPTLKHRIQISARSKLLPDRTANKKAECEQTLLQRCLPYHVHSLSVVAKIRPCYTHICAQVTLCRDLLLQNLTFSLARFFALLVSTASFLLKVVLFTGYGKAWLWQGMVMGRHGYGKAWFLITACDNGTSSFASQYGEKVYSTMLALNHHSIIIVDRGQP